MAGLESLKQELIERMQALESRIRSIDAEVSHHNQPLSSDWSEQAVERENDEVLEALGNASQNELAQIRRALARIDSGAYQICEACGQEIPLQRLRLVPHTVYCTHCAEELESVSGS